MCTHSLLVITFAPILCTVQIHISTREHERVKLSLEEKLREVSSSKYKVQGIQYKVLPLTTRGEVARGGQ